MTVHWQKHRFLSYELGLLSIKAAMATRDKGWPIYEASKKLHQRLDAKLAIRDVLSEIESKYTDGGIDETTHTQFIVNTADSLSSNLKPHWHCGRFRIGVAQKLVNLHLKYLWVAGICAEPPHCPIDGIIRTHARLDFDWTRSDSIEEYTNAVAMLKARARPQSLAVWELENFRRRDDET